MLRLNFTGQVIHLYSIGLKSLDYVMPREWGQLSEAVSKNLTKLLPSVFIVTLDCAKSWVLHFQLKAKVKAFGSYIMENILKVCQVIDA